MTAPAPTGFASRTCEGHKKKPHVEGQVTDLELKYNGSYAWIQTGVPVPGQFPAIWAIDSFGQRRLDSGNVSLKSLSLSGSTLTWRKDGVVRSATLH